MIISMKHIQRLVLVALVFFAVPVSAQLQTDFLGASTELIVSPEFPQPGETVSVEFANFGRYSRNDIVWRLNGEVIANANNRRAVEYVASSLGKEDIVTATVVLPSGSTRSFTVQVVPTYVDIVIEPQTRVPNFYEGRAVPSIGSQVNATALVNNGKLLTGDYLYTWRVNGQALEGGPIRGTNQVTFETPRGSRVLLQLTVTDTDGNTLGKKALYVESVKPEMVFYEFNSLHSQSHIAISDTLIMVGSAATIVAEPYYLDIRTYNNPDISEWEIDRDTQDNSNSNPYRITVQNVEQGGQSKVSFHVRSTTELLQGVEDSINIAY